MQIPELLVQCNREGPVQEPWEVSQLWTHTSVKPCCSEGPLFYFYSGCGALILGVFVVSSLFLFYMSLCSYESTSSQVSIDRLLKELSKLC